MIVEVGLKPDEFWSNTFLHNELLAKHKREKDERESLLNRNIEFALYATSFRGMSGEKAFKQIKKPQDLYKLPSEIIKKNKEKAVFDPERAIAAYNKTVKDETQWLTKN